MTMTTKTTRSPSTELDDLRLAMDIQNSLRNLVDALHGLRADMAAREKLAGAIVSAASDVLVAIRQGDGPCPCCGSSRSREGHLMHSIGCTAYALDAALANW